MMLWKQKWTTYLKIVILWTTLNPLHLFCHVILFRILVAVLENDLFFLLVEKRKLLPTNYTHQTGEENEETMFCSRAKLYRFDKGTSQWKERGIGEIKILKQKNEGLCLFL